MSLWNAFAAKKKSIEGRPCKVTDRKETCLAMGNLARMVLISNVGREIARDEAMGIIEQNQRQGLINPPPLYPLF